MKFSVTKAAAAAVAVMLAAASSTFALTNPTLLYSFENPPGDPNGPLDGFAPNTSNPADTTLSQSTIGATDGSNSLLFAQNATATYTGALNQTIPEALNDPATTALSLDVTVPAGGQFAGGFANLGISEFAMDNDQSVYGTFVFNFQTQATEQNVDLSVGTHRVVIFLEYQYDPNPPYSSGPNSAGVSFSSLIGTGPEQFTPSSFEFYVSKGATTGGANPLPNAALNLYVDNIQAITASGWNTDASGDWNTSANWYGAIPNGVGADAEFIDPVGATNTDTITTAIPVTVGTLHFNYYNAHTLSGAGSLTLQTSTGSASVVVDLAAAETISLPLTIASNTTLNVPTNATLTMSGPVTVNAGKSLTPTGSGLETYTSNITLLAGATMTFGNTTQANVLSLANGSVASITPHGSNPKILLGLAGLTLGGASNNWQGTLDLTTNDLIVHGGILSQIANQIKMAFNAGHGYWNGAAGITSTAAETNASHLTALGYGTGGATFDGLSTIASDVLVKYTYYGDANLDGTVNGADYQQIDLGFGSHFTGWSNGDFNYDGVVDGSDFSLIDNTFNQITATGASALAMIAAPADLSALPEPSTLALLTLATIGVLCSRRRRDAETL